MEVKHAAGGSVDLLMECDEEEPELWLLTPHRDEEEEEENEALEAADSPVEEEDEEEQEEPPPVRIIPIPVQPVKSCSPPPVKCAEGLLGFMVNGRTLPLLPGGGGVELRLRCHPKGSYSGFSSVQIPINLRVLHHRDHTGTTNTPPPEPEPGPEVGSTPIITGVVSGEAAEKVLSDHNVNFKLNPPLKDLKTPSLSHTTPPAPQGSSPSQSSRVAPHRPTHKGKGELGQPPPHDCPVCLSRYKLVTALRGFMCLCSPDIAQSLRNLKKRNRLRRRSRDRLKLSRVSRESQSIRVSRTRPPAKRHRTHDDVLLDQFSPTSPSNTSPQQDQSDPLPDPPHSKLVILVEDFYYGSAPGCSSTKPSLQGRKFTGPYRCIHCSDTLHNNLELMSHMKEHVATMAEEDGDVDTVPSCPRCFRRFPSPFKLQCHLEAVHCQYKSAVTCRICELDFSSEPAFLWHMKNTHKPGEMPYACQVCDFRSSFYSDVWSHFQEAHANTKHLLCQYCLRVLSSNTCYQQHFARHQKKHVFGCDRCRLHFLYIKERMEHKLLHHKTHVRPPQLSGLRPGTKVTVRTYSVVGGSEAAVPCKVVNVAPPLPPQEVPQRKPVQNLDLVLSHLSEAAGGSWPSPRCVECLSVIQDFRTHFPSLVHCSLCKFITCCSTSYANHMINNHTTCRKNPQYHSIFQSQPQLSAVRLECLSCSLFTCKGDVMANHLVERPDHCCTVHTERSGNGEQWKQTIHSMTSSVWSRGGFIPIHLIQSGQTATPLSVKPLTSPSPLSSPPAMTITFLGSQPRHEKADVPRLLSVLQLSAVLCSLCHSLSHASRCHGMSPQLILAWTRQRQRQLQDKKWKWKTEKLLDWVLNRRERQLKVSEDFLLRTARGALGQDGPLRDQYHWPVDFLLRYDISLQTTAATGGAIVTSRIGEQINTFIQTLCSQTKGVPPHCVGCMDEFSVFVDSAAFRAQDPAALQVSSWPGERPLFDVVLSGLSDGTLLPPLLFFRGKSSQIPDGFPDNILLEAQQDGFTDQDRLEIWINKVWRPHVALHPCNSQFILMLDVHRGHLMDRFRDSLSSVSTDALFIPDGCCCRLQPLDVCVVPVLRDFLQARWTQLVSQGGVDGLGLDHLALTVACWISEMSSTLRAEPDFLCRSFSSVCDLQQLEDRRKVTAMIRSLTKALIQPPEGLGPGPGPGLDMDLLLLTEEEEEGSLMAAPNPRISV